MGALYDLSVEYNCFAFMSLKLVFMFQQQIVKLQDICTITGNVVLAILQNAQTFKEDIFLVFFLYGKFCFVVFPQM